MHDVVDKADVPFTGVKAPTAKESMLAFFQALRNLPRDADLFDQPAQGTRRQVILSAIEQYFAGRFFPTNFDGWNELYHGLGATIEEALENFEQGKEAVALGFAERRRIEGGAERLMDGLAKGDGWKGTIPAEGTRRRIILDAIRKGDVLSDTEALEIADTVEAALLAEEAPLAIRGSWTPCTDTYSLSYDEVERLRAFGVEFNPDPDPDPAPDFSALMQNDVEALDPFSQRGREVIRQMAEREPPSGDDPEGDACEDSCDELCDTGGEPPLHDRHVSAENARRLAKAESWFTWTSCRLVEPRPDGDVEGLMRDAREFVEAHEAAEAAHLASREDLFGVDLGETDGIDD